MFQKWLSLCFIGLIVVALSAGFNLGCDSSDNENPEITATILPANGAVDQALNVEVKVTFSGNISVVDDWTGNFTLTKQGGDGINLCTAYTDNLAETEPNVICVHENFEKATTYVATVTAVKNGDNQDVAEVTSTFETTTSDLVEDNITAMKYLPDLDPTIFDYSLNAPVASVSKNAKNIKTMVSTNKRPMPSGNDVLKIVSEVVENGSRNFTLDQCMDEGVEAEDVFQFLFSFNENLYTGLIKFRLGEMSYDINLDITNKAITDDGFLGSITFVDYENITTKFEANGATQTNTLSISSEHGHIVSRWNETSGCFKSDVEGLALVPFTLSIQADGSRKFAASEDSTLCDDMPDYVTIGTYSGAIANPWDCVVGEPLFNLDSLTDLGAEGDAHCEELATLMSESDFWYGNEWSMGDCESESGTINKVQCYSNAAYGAIIQESRIIEYLSYCKTKGAFSQTTTPVTFNDNETIYIDIPDWEGPGD